MKKPDLMNPVELQEGENRKVWGLRRRRMFLEYVIRFFQENGHVRFPEGVVFGGAECRSLWFSAVNDYRKGILVPRHLALMENLVASGVSLDKERIKVRENLAPLERQRSEPALQAIRSFAAKKGHTRIPEQRVTKTGGLRYGLMANAWRRAHASENLNPWITGELEKIPEWTWELPENSRKKREAAIPPDDTRMNRTGLRQFSPDS